MLYPARQHVLNTLKKLIAIVPEADKTKTHVALVIGEDTHYRNDTDGEMPFRQESNFYYLTGCQIPSSMLLITYAYGTSLEQNPSTSLFIPPITEEDITWSVPPPTLEEAKKLFEATQILLTTDFLVTLQRIFEAFPDSILHILPKSRLFPDLPTDFLLHDLSPHATSEYLLTALQNTRLIKSPWEIEQIRIANDISSRAHETVMRVLALGVKSGYQSVTPKDRPLLPGEWSIEREQDAEAIFVASCRREGAVRQAYRSIVASAVRAAILHYCCNDKAFAWGPLDPAKSSNLIGLSALAPYSHPNLHAGGLEHVHPPHVQEGQPKADIAPQVLLIDAGCEWENYASDITRTMPVGNGGKFAPETKAIYSIVLEMQEKATQALKPGVHWDSMHLLCHRILIKGFSVLGIFKSTFSEEEILNSGVTCAFFPHGLGHSLGLDVHDVPGASKPESGEGRSKLPDTLPPKTAHGIFRYLRLRLPLKEGMVLTVEPGIYFSPHLLASVEKSEYINHDVLAKYKSVGGIRIEDVVAITSTGYDVLTKVGKSVEWLENVCSGNL